MIIAAVCLLTACCTASRRPDVTLYPDKAAFKEEQFLAKLRDARRLAQAGKAADALREYLLLFDRSKLVAALGGVRSTFLVTEIVALGREYPAAINALRDRRDAMQRRALADPDAHEDFLDIRAINTRIGESDRTIALYDKLKASGSRFASSVQAFGQVLCFDLLAAKRTDDFIAVERYCMRRHSDILATAELDYDYPASDDDRTMATVAIRTGKERAFPVFEALISLGRMEAASTLKKRLLRPRPDGYTYKRLVEAALAAKKIEIARVLLKEARCQLPPDELTQVEDAAKAIDRD
jgi:hypothetical protein